MITPEYFQEIADNPKYEQNRKLAEERKSLDVKINYFAFILNAALTFGCFLLCLKCFWMSRNGEHFGFISINNVIDKEFEDWMFIPLVFASGALATFHFTNVSEREKELKNEKSGADWFSFNYDKIYLLVGTFFFAVFLTQLFILKSSYVTKFFLTGQAVIAYSYLFKLETFVKVFWPLVIPVFFVVVHFSKSKVDSWTNLFKPWYLYKKNSDQV